MKTLMVILAMVVGFNCSSITDPLENGEQVFSETYTLPYDRHYDGDAKFVSDNPIDTSGVIKQVIFSVSNFNDTVEFSFFISQNYDNRFSDSDTLYFSPKLSTEAIEKGTFTLDVEFDGLINVHINRYETYKPIDFTCEIKYTIR